MTDRSDDGSSGGGQVALDHRAYIDNAPVGVFVVDAAGRYVDVNPEACQMLGYSRDELLSMSIVDVTAADVEGDPSSDAAFFRVTHDGRAREQVSLVHRDGHVVEVILDAVALQNDHYLAYCQDITERKAYERELQTQQRKYATLVEQSHDGVVIITDGRFAYVNRQVEQLTGRSAADLVGTPFQTVAAPHQQDRLLDRYRARIRGEDVESRYDIDIRHPDGSSRAVSVQASTIDYRGETAVLATLRDITERKAYEEMVREQNEKLQLFNEIVRHDIRNDMNVVLGYAELVGETITDPDARAKFETLVERSEHVVELTEIIRDLTDVMLNEPDQEAQVDLVTVLEDVITDVTTSTALAVEPSWAETRVMVTADDSLGIVFTNILTNAVNHNDTDQPRAVVSLQQSAEAVTVRIADNGPGIADDEKERVFGRGEKGLDSPGTGIGLYLVERLVDGYGGEVWIEDNEPTGSVLNVRLATA
jgi:PAS domain S-box-containing protein